MADKFALSKDDVAKLQSLLRKFPDNQQPIGRKHVQDQTPVYVGETTEAIASNGTGEVCIVDSNTFQSLGFKFDCRTYGNAISAKKRVYVFWTDGIWSCTEIPLQCIKLVLSKCDECCDSCESSSGCEDSTGCSHMYATSVQSTTGTVILDDLIGKTVQTTTGGCFFVRCANGSTETGTSINIQEIYNICDECTCLTLTPCSSSLSVKKTYTKLKTLGFTTGKYVRLASTVGSSVGSECWLIGLSTSCTGAVPVDIAAGYYNLTTFTNCTDCENSTGEAWKVSQNCCSEKCSTSSSTAEVEILIVRENLAPVLGSYIKHDGKCWHVSTASSTATVDQDDFTYNGESYAGCSDCLADPFTGVKDMWGKVTVSTSAGEITQHFEKWHFADGLLVNICDESTVEIPSQTCSTSTGAST